jgi:hypothetical protein
MRHLGSFLVGVLVAPAAWLLLAIGQPQTAHTVTRYLDSRTYDTVDLLGPVGYLAAAGLLLGLLACLRLSPVGPALAGAAYTAVYVALFVDPLRTVDAIPEQVDLWFLHAQPRVPVANGTLAFVAVCLLVALLSVRRWQRWPAAGPQAASRPGAMEPSPEPPPTLPAAGPLVRVTDAEVAERPARRQPMPARPTAPSPEAAPEPTPAPRSAPPTVAEPADTGPGTAGAPSSPPPWPPPPEEAPPAEPPQPVEPAAADTPAPTGADPDAPPRSPWAAPPKAPRR